MTNEAVLYDTSIISNFSMLRHKEKFETTFSQIQKKGFLKVDEYFTISMPLLTVEVCGHGNLKEIINLHEYKDQFKSIFDDYTENNVAEVIERLHDLVYKILSKNSKLQPQELIRVTKEREHYYNQWWKTLMYDVFLRNMHDSTYKDWFFEVLSLEIIQNIDFESFLPREVLIRFNTEWVHYFYHMQNSIFANIVFSRRVLKYFNIAFKKEKAFIASDGDLVDSHLVHYALFGYKTKTQERKVRIVTCESKQTTMRRIFIYYSALKHIEALSSGKLKLKLNPGYICHVCNLSGKIINYTYVQKEIDIITKSKYPQPF
jgi:hypothetical protein